MIKKCRKCQEVKPLEQYHKHPKGYLGRETKCKSCRKISRADRYWSTKEECAKKAKKYYQNNKESFAARGAKRRASKIQRTPAWFEEKEVAWMYRHCPEGMEVDHVIPLQGDTVSGLHVYANLQYLSMSDNRSKGSRSIL
jgi:hypothetical protein